MAGGAIEIRDPDPEVTKTKKNNDQLKKEAKIRADFAAEQTRAETYLNLIKERLPDLRRDSILSRGQWDAMQDVQGDLSHKLQYIFGNLSRDWASLGYDKLNLKIAINMISQPDGYHVIAQVLKNKNSKQPHGEPFEIAVIAPPEYRKMPTKEITYSLQ